MKAKRILALCIFSALLTSCAGTSSPSEVTTVPTGDTTVETEADISPKIDLDLNGDTITILYREQMKDEFCADEQNGDIVNDAVYKRNLDVENAVNCKLEYLPNLSTDWNGGYQSVISQCVLAGDEAYDIISGPSFHIPTLIVDGYLTNLSEVPYLDFSKPWWTQGLLETTCFGDKVYLVSGDISMGMIRYLHCTYYNMTLGKSYNFENIFDIVLDGRWTLTKLQELCKDKYQDLNNNGAIDYQSDAFGYLLNNTTLWRAYIDALDVNYFYINKNGEPEFNWSDQRSFDVCELFEKLMGSGSNGDIYMTGTWANTDIAQIFKNDRAIFVMGRFIDCEADYRDMKSDYAIIPVPKWDESQDYEVTINGSESTFGIPINSSKKNVLGGVMELLAYESYRTVTPAYYESALKIKYTRGEESNDAAKVIDLIKNGAKFNPTVQLSKLLGGSDYFIQNSFTAGTGLASTFAENKTKMETALKDVLSKIS